MSTSDCHRVLQAVAGSGDSILRAPIPDLFPFRTDTCRNGTEKTPILPRVEANDFLQLIARYGAPYKEGRHVGFKRGCYEEELALVCWLTSVRALCSPCSVIFSCGRFDQRFPALPPLSNTKSGFLRVPPVAVHLRVQLRLCEVVRKVT
jgi:hypothetical protein